MIWNGYDVTLYVGQLHLITFYRTENCFLMCALVFLGSFCVPYTNSLIKFYFITIIINAKYMGTTRHFSLVTTTPSQSIGLVYWVCVVLVLSLICVPFVDTRGEVIERFSNKHNLCILNDGTHTYLKPQAHHANKPTSAIDSQFPHQDLLWEVCGRCCRIPMEVTIILYWLRSYHQWQRYNQAVILPIGFFQGQLGTVSWCVYGKESISEDILEEADPLHSFVGRITKAANDCIPRATTIPKKSNPWFDEECQEALKARRALDERVEHSREFNEYREAKGSHDEVYTDGSKMNEKVGAAAVINLHCQNGETTCRQLSKRLPDNSTIFAVEATGISLALNYYQHMDPVHHDVVVYSDSMSCLQAIEGEDTKNPFICHIMNLLWSLSDKGTCVRLCWVPSHCGIDGNEKSGPTS